MSHEQARVSKADVALIGIVADRAEELGIIRRDQRASLIMKLIDAHSHVPLELQQMIDASRDDNYRGSFGHDIAGVWNNWDPTGQKFRDCFSPRFAVREGGG